MTSRQKRYNWDKAINTEDLPNGLLENNSNRLVYKHCYYGVIVIEKKQVKVVK